MKKCCLLLKILTISVVVLIPLADGDTDCLRETNPEVLGRIRPAVGFSNTGGT